MKKITQLFLLLLVPFWLQAQIITSNPAFPTENDEVEIIFDAALGAGGLKGYTGTDVYAHTGVITDRSTGDSDWKYAPAWLDNDPKYRLTSLGNDKWQLIITPSVREYYGVPAGETIRRMAFVFRNGTGTREGKDTGGRDIFLDVYEEGLNVSFANPDNDIAVVAGTSMNISINSSMAANLDLLINGTSVATNNNATTLTHTYTFSNTIDYTLIARATSGSETVYDTVYVCVPAPVTNEARPAGVKNGINYINSTTVTFVLHAPNKQNAFLIGDFNNWRQLNAYQMKKDGDFWWYTLSDVTPGELYAFQYLVDGTLRASDPYTELVLDPWNDKWINEYNMIFPDLKPYPETRTDGLVATFQTNKPAYNWEVTDFQMPEKDNMIIYELLLRDFTEEKSLEAAIAKLDYLQYLGVNAIELMPIQEFDGNNSWGYNPNHYFAPDKAYGPPEMYKRFIDECHKRGIAVILDVVFNHASGISPFALLYWDSTNNRPTSSNPWMNTVAPHPFSVLNDFNHESSYTRAYFKEVLQYWIREYNIDGYRLDLTKGFTQNQSTEQTASNYDQSRIDILKDYYNATRSEKSDVMFILEHFTNNDEESVLANEGMFLWRKVNEEFSQAAMGYQSGSNFGGMNSLPRRWVGFAESHDEERNFYKVKMYGAANLQTDSIARFARIPLNVAFATLVPGPKMLWQFQELGFDFSIDSFGGRTDPKPSAFTLNWLDVPGRRDAYEKSAKIITMRTEYPNAFIWGNAQLNIAESDWNQGRRIAITHNDLNMIALGNFRADATITANPNFSKTGTWYELLSGEELNVTNTNMTINIPAGGLRIYTDRIISSPDGIGENKTVSGIYVYPTVTDGKLFVNADDVNSISVYNLQGALVSTVSNTSEIDVTALVNGYYIVKVQTSGETISQKFIKK